jgi:hypothetical protein
MLLFMSIFGFIGLTVLIFLWTARGFGAPPLIFRLFGSFIAIAFMIMGFGMPLTLFLKGRGPDTPGFFPNSDPVPGKIGTYDCPNCGANVGDADVSPSGDIKCTYCNEWWNIHGK